MTEKIPRWGLSEVDFLEVDPEKIKASIISQYEEVAGRKLEAGDPIRLFLLSIAANLILVRQAVNYSAQQNLLTYAKGIYLDAWGESYSEVRLPAAKAVTTIQFTLSQALGNAFVIPKGFEVSAGEVTFSTDSELVIEVGQRTGEVTASCTQAGEIGNDYVAGQISTIVTPLPYLEKAENTETSVGGADIEDDEDYANRLRLVPDSFSTAGPELAYIFYAKSFSASIIDVKPVSPTPGEVDIYALLEGGDLPNESFLTSLENHLRDEKIRPITDYVVAKSPEAVNYNLVVEYWVNRKDASNLTTIQNRVSDAVEQYRLWQQSAIGRDISQDELIAMVKNAGAARIKHETLSPNQFIELEPTQVAQCQSVKVSFLGFKDD